MHRLSGRVANRGEFGKSEDRTWLGKLPLPGAIKGTAVDLQQLSGRPSARH
jgi:hypothetical protein